LPAVGFGLLADSAAVIVSAAAARITARIAPFSPKRNAPDEQTYFRACILGHDQSVVDLFLRNTSSCRH
jgi:hypothetical protein